MVSDGLWTDLLPERRAYTGKLDLSTPLMYVKGVGPARAKMLESKSLVVVEDILTYTPFRYEDRRNVKTIAQLAPGEMATVIAEVRDSRVTGLQRRNVGLFQANFSDGSREVLTGKWFHGAYLKDVLVPGVKVALYGKVEFDSYTAGLTVMHPEYEILADDEESDSGLHSGRIVPIYEAAGKVNTRLFRMLLHRILGELPALVDALPEIIRSRLRLPDLDIAVRTVHFPGEHDDVRLLNNFRSPSQFRMIFEEFFWLECGLTLKKSKARIRTGIAFDLNDRVREKIKAMLPFKPTAAQKRVLGEIAQDMAKPNPMYRLLQGDVGSGKTLVAAEAAIIAIENGCQVAVLAPTEILATQHFFSFREMFKKLGYVVILLTGSGSKREKEQLKKLLAAGLAHVVVGTHALIEENVGFQRLGLAIIDEQHRFGVEQRLKLVEKGANPDVLVMTATPIPRTLALTLYGDLDVSIIDELPPGRKPIVTRNVPEDRIEQVYSFLKQQVDLGRQAYVVYPLIEESETLAVKAAQKMYEHLSTVVLPGYRIGLLHGRLLAGRERRRNEPLQGPRVADSGFDDRDRSGRGCPERDADGDRAGGTVRAFATAPTSRTGGARRRAELLRAGNGQDERGGAGADPHHGGLERRFPYRRDGHEAAGAGGVFRHQAIRAAGVADWQHCA